MKNPIPMTEAQKIQLAGIRARNNKARYTESDQAYADELFAGGAELSVCRAIGGESWQPPAPAAKPVKRSQDKRSPRKRAPGQSVYDDPDNDWLADVITVQSAGLSSSVIRGRSMQDAVSRLHSWEIELKGHVLARDEIGMRARRCAGEHARTLGLDETRGRVLCKRGNVRSPRGSKRVAQTQQLS